MPRCMPYLMPWVTTADTETDHRRTRPWSDHARAGFYRQLLRTQSQGCYGIQNQGESYELTQDSKHEVPLNPPESRARRNAFYRVIPRWKGKSGALYGIHPHHTRHEATVDEKISSGKLETAPSSKEAPKRHDRNAPHNRAPPQPLQSVPYTMDSRRRDPRISGSDVYVARLKKSGEGNAMPCWRCVEWCRWAGVKRIFHWDADKVRWQVVKVNDSDIKLYQTRSDYANGRIIP
ncbi:hypothetical protein FRB94_005604 [Tulasnella sp. JGI-2019a]|nr:hypothetical protein FRB94_005604 [Tulasnella sp. JGI-2019a]